MQRTRKPHSGIFTCFAILAGLALTPAALQADTSASTVEPRSVAQRRVSASASQLPGPTGRGSLPPPPEVVLPTFEHGVLQALQQTHGSSWLGPNRLIAESTNASVVTTTPTTSVSGIWLTIEPGTYLWRTTIRSSGASALRIRFEDFNANGQVYIYNSESTSSDPYLGPFQNQGPQADGDFWSDILLGESLTVEFVPSDQSTIPTVLPFAVREIAHIINVPHQRFAGKNIRDTNSILMNVPEPRRIVGCHLDVSCYPEWEDRAQPATALLIITKPDGTYSCSGVLINPRYDSADHLLMLTAAHCIENEEIASNAIIYWDYQTTECYGQLPDNYRFASTTGANLVLSRGPDRNFDFSLLRLDLQSVLAVTGVTHMGWSPRYVSTGSEVINVSHPDGKFKRIAFGRTTYSSWRGLSSLENGSVRWDRGTVEGGSSGSGLFLEEGYLIGIIRGSSRDVEACDLEYRASYNRFEYIYPEIESYLESEDHLESALDLFRPKPVRVRLGAWGGTVTLMTTSDGRYTLDGRIFVSGDSVIGEGGREYRLTLNNSGNWQSTFVPRHVNVRLGSSGSAVTLSTTEDGRFSMNRRIFQSGDIVSTPTGLQYRVTVGRDGVWRATFLPATVRVPLDTSGDFIELQTTEYGGYTLGGQPVSSGSSLTTVDGDEYELSIDNQGAWTATLISGSLEVHLTPSIRLMLERVQGGRFLYDDQFVVGGSVVTRGHHEAYRLERSNEGDWLSTPFLGDFQPAVQHFDIETLIGVGVYGYGGDNSRASTALIANPYYAVADEQGNIFVSDSGNHRIRQVDSQGFIRTIAGTGQPGFSGDGGPAVSAQLRNPRGIHVDSSGTLYVADAANHRIRMIHPWGTITTLAGTGQSGYSGDGGLARIAQLSNPSGVTTDLMGNVFVSDTGNHCVRRISQGYISTVAGTGAAGYGGDEGPAVSASLQIPTAITTDLIGNVYVADMLNHRVRKIDLDGGITTVMGIGTAGNSGDGQLGALAQIDTPVGVAWDWSGGLYVVDRKSNVVRALDPLGVVNSIAGIRTSGYGGDGGLAGLAQLNSPTGIAAITDGNLLVADTRNHRVRRLAPRRQVVPPDQVQAQVLVPLGDSGQALRLWRLGNQFSYLGESISSGDDVFGWDGERYRLIRSGSGQWHSRLVPTDFVNAAVEYRQEALEGDAEAQFELGWLYFLGLGVPEDNAAALKWFTLAAAGGHAEAQAAIGVMYREGYGVLQNPSEALNAFRRSANLGSPSGLHYLGMMFYNGEGVTQNHSVAARFFRLAAFADHDEAQLWMGFLFESGNGVPQSYEESVKWYLLSAEQGNTSSQASLGNAYYSGEGVPQDYVQAAQWFRRAANQGYANAQSFLGFLYTQGRGVARNDQESVRWFQRAAEQGHAYGQWLLGRAYANGSGTTPNSITAHVWLSLAVANGEDRAQQDLAETESDMSTSEIRRAQSLMTTCRESGYSNCP